MVQFLVSHRCNLKAIDRQGRHAIHYAAYHGHLDTTLYLIANADKPNPIDRRVHHCVWMD